MAAAGKLSEKEIVRGLDNRAGVRGGRKIPIKLVAEMAGLNRATLFRAMMEGRLSERSRAVLSHVLIMVQTGV